MNSTGGHDDICRYVKNSHRLNHKNPLQFHWFCISLGIVSFPNLKYSSQFESILFNYHSNIKWSISSPDWKIGWTEIRKKISSSQLRISLENFDFRAEKLPRKSEKKKTSEDYVTLISIKDLKKISSRRNSIPSKASFQFEGFLLTVGFFLSLENCSGAPIFVFNLKMKTELRSVFNSFSSRKLVGKMKKIFFQN